MKNLDNRVFISATSGDEILGVLIGEDIENVWNRLSEVTVLDNVAEKTPCKSCQLEYYPPILTNVDLCGRCTSYGNLEVSPLTKGTRNIWDDATLILLEETYE